MSQAVEQYSYDIFVSYRHSSLTAHWIKEVVDRIEYWLTQELGGGDDVQVFFDVRSIDVGVRWPDKLKNALRSSRCLLPILSPDYFRSSWCLAEWKSFVERQKLLPEAAPELIAPIKFHDGQWFPPEAQAMQHLDLCKYVSTVPSYWQTARAAELDHELLAFAPRLASMVLAAPPYRDDWPVHEPDPPPPPRNVPMRRME